MRDHCCHQSDFLWWSPLPQALPEGSPPGGGKLWSSLHSRQGTTPHFSQQNQTTATGHCKSCWCCGLGSSYVSPMYFIHNWRQYGQHQSKLFFETTALLLSGIPIDQQAPRRCLHAQSCHGHIQTSAPRCGLASKIILNRCQAHQKSWSNFKICTHMYIYSYIIVCTHTYIIYIYMY